MNATREQAASCLDYLEGAIARGVLDGLQCENEYQFHEAVYNHNRAGNDGPKRPRKHKVRQGPRLKYPPEHILRAVNWYRANKPHGATGEAAGRRFGLSRDSVSYHNHPKRYAQLLAQVNGANL
ncbi:MAG: hypothetical protein AAGF10_07980 [Verrucomicrobiota bacterium]